ncbi:Golgi SNARE 11 family protein [Populus alba x Populus x berolinensis]|uniref:Golgi SNARE 11 family protein n=1 Tax=Populus alba x Populus x berolinensis TaxID=444605 RepID=A0AAD6WF09_9ROSI|nr:Golgi SNARE 11 family protein [Populus alba x Populus x berolinensis]
MEVTATSSWDALRKQARKLEAQLDEQMNSYRKLASSKGSTKVDSAENDPESGIDRLLKQLQQVNSQMQAWVSSGGSEMVSHTLTRHQEILQDLTQEFHRLRSGMRAKQEHALLLEDFREFDRTRLDLEDGIGSADQALLREHASISRNTGQMDNVISQAQATLGSLVLQRSTFGGINSKLSNVSSRLPTVNQILSAIKRRKSMDSIILSLVASTWCTALDQLGLPDSRGLELWCCEFSVAMRQMFGSNLNKFYVLLRNPHLVVFNINGSTVNTKVTRQKYQRPDYEKMRHHIPGGGVSTGGGGCGVL